MVESELRIVTARRGRLVVDSSALITMVLIAGVLCWLLATPFWLAELLVYGPPLAYLFVSSAAVRGALHGWFIVKAIVFCVVVFNYLGIRFDGWTGPSSLASIFGVPIEQAVWCALAIPLSIAVNQRFFARSAVQSKLRGARPMLYLLFFLGLAIALLPPLRSMMDGYVYLKIGLLIYPLIFLLAVLLDRSIVRELLYTGTVMFALNLGFELLALRNGYWEFPGEYVAWLAIDSYEFPLEELLFTLILSSPGVVAAYALRASWKGVSPSGRA